MKAKIMHGFMVVVLLFMQLMNLGGIQTAAATTPDQIEKVITTSNALDVNVTGTVQGDQINWALSYNKKDQGELRALKVRVSTDRDATLRLAPKANQLVQAMQGQDSQPKNQWWIEKAYSRSSQNVLYYSTPKTNNRLYVAVELNRREASQAASTTTTVEATDAEADPDPLQTPVDSALTDTLVGPVEVLLPLSTATEEEQAVAIDRPAANTVQTEADAANTVANVVETVQATQGLLNANIYAKAYDHSRAINPNDYRMPLTYTAAGNADGVYPTSAWAFNGNTNVKNHIGGNSQHNALYSNTNVNTANANTWLDYGANQADPEFSIRKYAKESTTTKGLFDVQLDIKGNTIDNSKPLALVLVLDYSGSMGGDNDDRIKALRAGVTNFMADIRNAGFANLVSVGVVGFSSEAKGLFSVAIDTLAKNEDKINDVLGTPPSGGTFTQAGLTLGAEMLKTSPIADKKMIVLTDGVPTFAYKITAVANLNDADRTLIGTGFQTSGTGSVRGSGSSPVLGTSSTTGRYYVGSTLITDTWSATTGQAHLIKESGVTLQVLGIEIKDASGSTQANTLQQMKKWASLGSDNQPLFQEAHNATDVETYLDAQAKVVIDTFSTVQDGTVTDPLGAQFSFNTNANGQVIQPTVTSDNATVQPEVTISGRTINVTKLTLGKNQTATIKYQVRINTEAEGFKADHWYPMNGTTTFTAKAGTPTVNFGVPSAKAPSKVYTLTKDWQTLDEGVSKPASLTVGIAREGSVFANPQTLTLRPDSWTTTFTDVAYGNLGQELKYTVTSEQGMDASYIWRSSYQASTAKLTLTNVQYGVQVEKKSTDSEYPITTEVAASAEFALNTYRDQTYTNAASSDLVVGIPQGLAAGFYGIVETTAPEGFELDPTEYLFRRDQDGK